MTKQPRGATISVVSETAELWFMSTDNFEEKLGMGFSALKAQAYLSDPRALIADVVVNGDQRGPGGLLSAEGWTVPEDPEKQSKWFVVYRPCSRDSIAKVGFSEILARIFLVDWSRNLVTNRSVAELKTPDPPTPAGRTSRRSGRIRRHDPLVP